MIRWFLLLMKTEQKIMLQEYYRKKVNNKIEIWKAH